MLCPKCRSLIPDNANFCPRCGAKTERPRICGNCGSHMMTSDNYCLNCGARFSVPDAPKVPRYNMPVPPIAHPAAVRRKTSTGWTIAQVISLIFFICLALITCYCIFSLAIHDLDWHKNWYNDEYDFYYSDILGIVTDVRQYSFKETMLGTSAVCFGGMLMFIVLFIISTRKRRR